MPCWKRAAFDRANELAAGSENAAERFFAYYGLWAGSFVGAELGPMREASEAFLRDGQLLSGSLEEAVAHRIVGTTALVPRRLRRRTAQVGTVKEIAIGDFALLPSAK
jgi:hypothetical protein